MTKLYTKPKVNDGEWYRCTKICKTNNDEDLFIAVQEIDGTEQDHYRIFVNGKAQPRVSYFGESAYHEVIRNALDLVHWSTSVEFIVPRENVKDWK